MRVIGVAIHAYGWIGIELRDGAFVRAMTASTLYEIGAGGSGAAVIGVDIPLGVLPDRCRAADALAAGLLGPRRGSIYRVPPWPVWQQTSYAAAGKVCRDLTGRGFSRQSWGVRAKLLEANALRERHPGLLVEARAEVSFRQMAGLPLANARTTWTGQAGRRELTGWPPVPPSVCRRRRSNTPAHRSPSGPSPARFPPAGADPASSLTGGSSWTPALTPTRTRFWNRP